MKRFILSTAIILTALWIERPIAQAPGQSASKPTPAAPAAKAAFVLRTPDGQPDLQGVWTNGTTTPFERPANLGAKAFYTDEEVAQQEQQAAARAANPPAGRGRGNIGIGGDPEPYMDSGYKPVSNHQTSLIVDPPDGRLPFTPDAEKKRDFNLANFDSWETMSPWDRCITRGPAGLFPANYNNAYQIVQTPGYVVIHQEMIHEARIIPVDGRPHENPRVRTWNGDSVGHWEGTTLVVDSTNFNDKGWITTHQGSGRLRGIPTTEALHIVEKFTRVDANTLSYQMTVTDPNSFTKPWTFAMPFVKNDNYQLYEYACIEGNQAIGLMLRGARQLEREAAK